MKERLQDLWTSSLAPSMGIMLQTLTAHGHTEKAAFSRGEMQERPFFYTPVYVLYDAILAVQGLKDPTPEQLTHIIYTAEVEAALAALVAARRDVPDAESHFPGPEASFCQAIFAIRSWVRRPVASKHRRSSAGTRKSA